jgi:hypothetical protein
MESLTTWGYVSPISPEKLKKLKEFYETKIKPEKQVLSQKIAEKLLALFLT